jgi:hypothetical protein
MQRKAEPIFYAFDLLWDEHAHSDDEQEMRTFRNGEDTRYLPLCDRKLRLRAMVPKKAERILFCVIIFYSSLHQSLDLDCANFLLQ